jgi:NAD(P)H-dependent flavin oxidoreductase YrpB (nitropropane dioxygenase family)
MGAVAPPELAAAVSEAGGLGMLGMAHPGLTAASLANRLDRLCTLTDKPFGVNFIVSPMHLNGTSTRPPLDLKCIEIAARAAKVVEFFYGEPERRLVEMVHAGGALACWQVGSREEAIAAAEAGCDFIIAQGVEAGGHVRGTSPVMTLLGEVISAVDVPVLAAGGIGTGRAMAAALAAGADGVRVGTRFVAATEAAAHPEYVAALIASQAEDTIYTTAFSRNWPDAPHRVLRSCVTAAEAFFQGDTVGEMTALDGTRMPALRLAAFGVDKTATGTIAAMALFAGTSVGAVTQVEPAAEILRKLVDECVRERQ